MKSHKLNELNSRIVELINTLPPLDWLTETEHQSITDAIVADGMTKKFEISDHEKEAYLKSICESEWVDFDSGLPDPGADMSSAPVWFRYVRDKLAEELSDFYIDYEDGWVGPGETFESAQGWVDPISKLENESWTVTPSCVDMFKTWLTSFRRIRRLIASSKLPRSEPVTKTIRVRGMDFKVTKPGFDVDATVKLHAAATGEGHYHKALFDLKLHNRIKVVKGNRFSSVPKNNRTRRPICIEALGNSICQRLIGNGIRRVLTRTGNDIDTGQERHRKMVATMKYATIDLRSASDSISLALIRAILPDFFVKLVEQTRSQYTLLSDGEWYENHKVSSMGNGFTFELMTLILLTTLRTTLGHSDLSVFGDDIIVPLKDYDRAIRSVEALGFTINRDKSCGDGVRAESCGVFAVNGEVILRYDFRQINSLADAITLANKVHNLLEVDQVSWRIRQVLEKIRLLMQCYIGPRYSGPRVKDPWGPIAIWHADGIVMEKTRFENTVSRLMQTDCRVVKARRTAIRRHKATGHLHVLVSLRSCCNSMKYNRNRTKEEDVTIIVSNGEILMTRQRWNKLQRGLCPDVTDSLDRDLPKGWSAQRLERVAP